MYKILIADDEALEREALSFFIRQSNLDIEEIIECSDGNDVVKKTLLYHPDIIILDINMPGLSGLDAFEQFKNADYPFKVIFSTAYDYFEYARKALKLGAMDFLVKPVKKEQFLTALNKAAEELEEETEAAKWDKRVKNMLDHMGQKILARLATGKIDEDVLYYLDTLGIPFEAEGAVFCAWNAGDIDENLKKEALDEIKENLSYFDIKVLSQWRNATATFIVFFPEGFSAEDIKLIEECIRRGFLNKRLPLICGRGSTFEDISQIEKSFDEARASIGDIQEFQDENADEEQIKNVDGLAAVKNIREFIDTNYEKHLTLDMIAEKAGYSKFYLNRLFKQHTDRTIMDYLIQTRINKAKELLRHEEYTVKQISAMVGYSEPNYFTITFKKAEGISPIKYRYQFQEEGR
ncbi:MAG: response regulator [Eubacteriales bacterium]|nr:response regulator [Eubacteriales bacterium]